MAKNNQNNANNNLNCVVVREIRTLRDYFHPTRISSSSCIVFPTNAGTFDLKLGVIQLLPKFHGLDSETPYLYVKEFENVCETLQNQNISDNVIRLKFFPFCLREKAKTYLNLNQKNYQ